MATTRVMSETKSKLYADAMIRCIHAELPDAAFFTREDLLHLSCFDAVATITRYAYVCATVRYCIQRKLMMEMTKTTLILTGGKARYQQELARGTEYDNTIIRILPAKPHMFTIGEIASAWHDRSDQHLTLNTKRMYVRVVFPRLILRDLIVSQGMNLYSRK